MIDYETTKERCQQMQENADDLEYQAKEDNDAITQDVKEDTVDSEQEAKEETNLHQHTQKLVPYPHFKFLCTDIGF